MSNKGEFLIDHSEKLSFHLGKFVNQKNKSDITLKVEGKEIPGHRLILASRSKPLEKLVKGNTSVEIPKFSYDIFLMVLSYCYTGTLTLKDDNVYHVLNCADIYELTDLRNSCFDFIVKSLDKDTVSTMLMQAKRKEFEFDTTELITKCFALIEKKTTDVIESPGFLSLDKDVIIQILQSDKIAVDEADLYKAAIKWGKNLCKDKENYSDLKEVVGDVMKHIRYPLIDAVDLITTVRHDGFMPRDLYIWALEYNASPDSFKYSEIPAFKERNKTFTGSSILNAKMSTQIFKWLGQQKAPAAKKQWKLIYNASKDGWTSQQFHSKCDNQGETICVFKASNGYIFGGYNAKPWTSNSTYAIDYTSFLFSLTNSKGYNPTLVPHMPGKGNSCYGCSTYGPTWGGGHDLYIVSNPNVSTGSYSNLGYSYSVQGMTYNTNPIKSFLAGAYNFMLTDFECFKVK
eukprot:gene3965-7221_t